MILAFSTKINGKLTYFVEKIHSGLLQNNLLQGFDLGYSHHFNIDILSSCQPKIHTIREDKNNRWKVDNNIDFFINARQKNMFRFAPVLPVVSTQKITIKRLENHSLFKVIRVSVDGEFLNKNEIKELAINDGFENTAEFFDYFNSNFEGKIIHWTSKQY